MVPHTRVLPGSKVMADRAIRRKFAWQQSPLTACPQEVKDGVEDSTKVGWCAVARPVSPPAELAQQKPTPRRYGRCRKIECSSYDASGPDHRYFCHEITSFHFHSFVMFNGGIWSCEAYKI